MATLERNLRNRSWLLGRLRSEIIGPDPPDPKTAISLEFPSAKGGKDDQESGPLFGSWKDFRRPKIQPNGQEILWQDSPIKRYGAGILFPSEFSELAAIAAEADSTPSGNQDEEPAEDVRTDKVLEENVRRHAAKRYGADDTDDYDVALANAWRPSAMGLSFLADLAAEAQGVTITVEFARYRRVQAGIQLDDSQESRAWRDLWFRIPGFDSNGNSPAVYFSCDELLKSATRIEKSVPGCEESSLRLSVVSRPYTEQTPSCRLITACLVNRAQHTAGRVDEQTFFQCRIEVSGRSGKEWLLPYPDAVTDTLPHEEDRINRLLYRDCQTFAIGHGCAADWCGLDAADPCPGGASRVWTDCLPTHETSSVSPDITDENSEPIRVSMRKLAGLDPDDDGFGEMERLTNAYRRWIELLEGLDMSRCLQTHVDRPPIPSGLKPIAEGLISRCKECLRRMEVGITFLRGGSQASKSARTAFRLTNEAMLTAQLRRSRDVRTPKWDDEHSHYVWDAPYPAVDILSSDQSRGYWRPFQIAFLLMSIRGICEPEHLDRETVDLIWFPTGGGKTEAYLGLTALTIFFSRLAGLRSDGADVIMRYTLRLLTTQQFERAGLLFCCMENMRQKYLHGMPQLGNKRFSLGMWVGGDASPNSRSEALIALRALQRDPDSENPFVLLRCPWCGARMGPTRQESRGRGRGRTGQGTEVLGYREDFLPGTRKKGFFYRCPDSRCDFGTRAGLPIKVIDEDIYDEPPNLVIGTVDKFALLTWKPEVRKLFGIDPEGRRAGIPPTLIIQDELHLISGPLGSLVGIYETVIEEACTWRKANGHVVRPKIVASTATISRATEQVRALYARERVEVFPPSGLEAGDSFFAREDRYPNGRLKPGRLYVGVMAPGHGSQQTTQARVYAALLQYPAMMPVDDESERDPWWTLVCFFNSLRELGGASTLLVADARDYLRVLLDRHGFSYDSIRQLLNWDELTSRIRSDQIPKRIQQLEIPFRRDDRGYVKDTVDACLASNIIEVGIDIDRLGLMAIIGQPKTTSQYIQVSSRVGRSANAPGLVVTVYSAAKPRDRSHYERFRPYHQRLYAQVEPTSVTPFSPPAVDRALHAIVVAGVRQLDSSSAASSPRPFPLMPGRPIRQLIEDLLLRRVRLVDPDEETLVMRRLQYRLREWQAWDPSEYGGFGPPPDNPPLMHPAGSHAREIWNGHSWPTMGSLRNVDATCEAELTTFYNELQSDEVEP